MSPPSFSHQRKVLAERYLSATLGDLGTVGLLLLQAPFIGWLCTLVWGSVETDTKSLYFVLSLAAVWFGCINACRAIVKERAIVEREKLLGLSVSAYLCSQFQILAMIGLGQVILLQLAVEWELALRGAFLLQSIALWGASIAGVGLGLLVSALSKSQERAVGAIPLIILPQILFSEFAIPKEQFGDVVIIVEKFMPVRWCYEIFCQLAALETEWGLVLLSFAVLGIISITLGVFTRLALIPQREIL
jgi:ABC transport system ATP-binding/permease protein